MTAFLPAVSTLNAVPRFANTTGSPLKDSLFVISDLGAGSGLTSQTIGNISINQTIDAISCATTLSLSGSAGVSISAGANSNIVASTTGIGTISLNSGSSLTFSAPGGNAITAQHDINLKAAALERQER